MKNLRIVYDGECPFCASYIALVRLRETYVVTLIDARKEPEPARAYGLDLNEGMIVDLEGQVYHGAKAVAMLSRLSRGTGLLSSEWLSEAIYPWMRRGRALTLRILGRKPI